MHVLSRPSNPERPENLVRRLVAQLNRHILWDSLLLFMPPAAAVVYVLALLYQAAWLSQTAVVVTAIFTLALGAFAVLLRRGPLFPTVRRAACLIDQRSGAKDHFLTLATLDPANQPSALLTRLRLQAEGFLTRIELRRDFPYKLKRSAYWSLGASLITAILVHLLLPVVQSARYSPTVQERLREIAQQMAAKPDLRTLAKDLQTLASKLDDQKISREDKQALAQDMEQKIKEQQKNEEQKDNRDLLSQAASALVDWKSSNRWRAAKISKRINKRVAVEFKAMRRKMAKEKTSKAREAAAKVKASQPHRARKRWTRESRLRPTRRSRGKRKTRPAMPKTIRINRIQTSQARIRSKEKAGKTEGGSKDGAGKQQASEEPPPQGGPQADRFYKPGEGKEGLAAKGYVTVQMPEELIADAKGESRTTKESKNSRARTQVPVSNVPLPAHVPNAPTEKQQVPIEYRGIIR